MKLSKNLEISTIIDALSSAPDTQIDKSVVVRLNELKNENLKDAVDQLESILTDCVKFSLTSGFALNAINQLQKMIKEEIEKK